MPKGFIDFQSKTLNSEHRAIYDVDPGEVCANIDKLHLIDVRRPEEFEGKLGHVPGSILLTLDYLPLKLNELPSDKTIVFICRSGHRSTQATAFTIKNGFESVFNMKGGMILWNKLGLKIERCGKF